MGTTPVALPNFLHFLLLGRVAYSTLSTLRIIRLFLDHGSSQKKNGTEKIGTSAHVKDESISCNMSDWYIGQFFGQARNQLPFF